jgi:hypothetical protein
MTETDGYFRNNVVRVDDSKGIVVFAKAPVGKGGSPERHDFNLSRISRRQKRRRDRCDRSSEAVADQGHLFKIGNVVENTRFEEFVVLKIAVVD